MDTAGWVLHELPEGLLTDDARRGVPDLYRSVPTDADGPWGDPAT